MRRLVCYFVALLDLFRHHSWMPHLYKETHSYGAIIIATDTSFRIAHTYEHTVDETVYPNALLIESECVYCGKRSVSWIRQWDKALPILNEEGNGLWKI